MQRTVRTTPKIMMLVAFTVISLLIILGWKTQTLLVDDKTASLTDAMTKEVSPLKRLVQERIGIEKTQLLKFANVRSANGAGRARGFGSFDVIALVQPTDGVGARAATWAPSWIEKGPEAARSEKWPVGHDTTLLKGLPYAHLKDGEIKWVRLSDAQGAPVYAVMIPIEVQNAPAAAQSNDGLDENVLLPVGSGRKAVVIGLTSSDPLVSLTDDYIGSTNTVYLVDDRGYVAAHVDKNYLGALFNEESVIQDLMKSEKIAASGKFQDIDGRAIYGVYERVGGTNLYAVITTPASTVTTFAADVRHVFFVFGTIFGALAIFAAWIIGRRIEAAAPVARRLGLNGEDESPVFIDTPTPNRAEVVAAFHNATPESAALEDRLRRERQNAFESFSRGFIATIREPLLSVIGHAQLLRAKSENREVLEHAASIERETRQAKKIVERFDSLSQSAEDILQENEAVDLKNVVEAAVTKLKSRIIDERVKLIEDIEFLPVLRGSRVDLEAAIVSALENALEALAQRADKRIAIRANLQGSEVRLTISDNGVGMTREIKDQAFEPFYRGFNNPHRLGLGLTFLRSTLQRFGAETELDSSIGEGTSILMTFTVNEEDRRAFLTGAPLFERAGEIELEVEALDFGAGAVSAISPNDNGLDDIEDNIRGERLPFLAVDEIADADEFETMRETTIDQTVSETTTSGEFKVTIRRPRKFDRKGT